MDEKCRGQISHGGHRSNRDIKVEDTEPKLIECEGFLRVFFSIAFEGSISARPISPCRKRLSFYNKPLLHLMNSFVFILYHCWLPKSGSHRYTEVGGSFSHSCCSCHNTALNLCPALPSAFQSLSKAAGQMSWH